MITKSSNVDVYVNIAYWWTSSLVVFGGPVFRGPVFGGPVFRGPVFGGPVFGGPVFRGPVLGGPVFRGCYIQAATIVLLGPIWNQHRPRRMFKNWSMWYYEILLNVSYICLVSDSSIHVYSQRLPVGIESYRPVYSFWTFDTKNVTLSYHVS